MPAPNTPPGPRGQFYAEPRPSPDPTSFKVVNNSAAYYKSAYFLAHKNQVQPIPAPRKSVAANIDLADFIPADVAKGIAGAKKIWFHAVGDTGAAKTSRSQSPATALAHESAVADAMVKEVDAGGPSAPAFFFHLGDVIYNFGEGQYYYDQFYDPFRDYNRPIFAVPGNHDGMVFGQSSSAPQVPTLAAFLTNFCASEPGQSPDAGGLVRSVMTQPGVYFTLDAPYVSIIGLYSNVLEGPGVISSQGNHFPIVDDQLNFLVSELTRLKPDRKAGKRAVIIAVHHPPLSADAKHGGSSGLEADIDAACKKAGLWPDAVLSGHAHLYQRFTRKLPSGNSIPYIVSGSGGFSATNPVAKMPPAPYTEGDYTVEIDPIVEFGYLTVSVDSNNLNIVFKTATRTAGVQQRDSVTVDLQKGSVVSSGAAAAPAKGGGGKPRPGRKPRPVRGGRGKKPAGGRKSRRP